MILYETQPRRCDVEMRDNLDFVSHIHRHVEMVLVEHGQLSMTVGGSHKLLSGGDLAVVFPHLAHSYRSTEPSRSILLIFDIDQAGAYARTLSGQQPSSPFLSAAELHPDAPLSMRRLLEGTASGAALDAGLTRGYLQVLLGRLLPLLGPQKRPDEQSPVLTDRALIYVSEHFREPLTLQSTADALCVSRCHLSHVFTQKIGCGFRQYLSMLRAEYARGLLSDTTLTITEVCFEAGFESLSTFYRVFRRQHGVTPAAAST